MKGIIPRQKSVLFQTSFWFTKHRKCIHNFKLSMGTCQTFTTSTSELTCQLQHTFRLPQCFPPHKHQQKDTFSHTEGANKEKIKQTQHSHQIRLQKKATKDTSTHSIWHFTVGLKKLIERWEKEDFRDRDTQYMSLWWPLGTHSYLLPPLAHSHKATGSSQLSQAFVSSKKNKKTNSPSHTFFHFALPLAHSQSHSVQHQSHSSIDKSRQYFYIHEKGERKKNNTHRLTQ